MGSNFHMSALMFLTGHRIKARTHVLGPFTCYQDDTTNAPASPEAFTQTWPQLRALHTRLEHIGRSSLSYEPDNIEQRERSSIGEQRSNHTNDVVQSIFFIPHNQHMLDIYDWMEWQLGAALCWLRWCWCLHDLSDPHYINMDAWSPCTPATIHLMDTLECDTFSAVGEEGRWWIPSKGVRAVKHSRIPYDINIATYLRIHSDEPLARKTSLLGDVDSAWTGPAIPFVHRSWHTCQPGVDNTVAHNTLNNVFSRLMKPVRMAAIMSNGWIWE